MEGSGSEDASIFTNPSNPNKDSKRFEPQTVLTHSNQASPDTPVDPAIVAQATSAATLAASLAANESTGGNQPPQQQASKAESSNSSDSTNTEKKQPHKMHEKRPTALQAPAASHNWTSNHTHLMHTPTSAPVPTTHYIPVQIMVPVSSSPTSALSQLTFPTTPSTAFVMMPASPTSAPSASHLEMGVPDFDKNVFAMRERKLVDRIREFMDSPKQNPRKGSMPSERVQNCIKQQYPQLYASVVGSEYANQWHRFIKSHGDAFELLFPEDGRNLPRIRLLAHDNFKEADRAEVDERMSRERTIVECLKHFLAEHEDDVTVEEFMNNYPNMTHNDVDKTLGETAPPPLPRFRDIVRLVKRRSDEFSYDPDGGSSGPRIRTAKTWTPPVHCSTPNSASVTAKKSPSSSLKRTQSAMSQSQTSSCVSKDVTFKEVISECGSPTSLSTTFDSSHQLFRAQSWSPGTAPPGFSSNDWGTPTTLRAVQSMHIDPHALVTDSDPHLFPLRERKLKQLIVTFLDSPSTNPHKGSVPSERVQNCIKAAHPDLYKSVVGAGYANQWHRFIQLHTDVFRLFYVEEAKRSVWRIRLEKHNDWQDADRCEREERTSREAHLLNCLQSYLSEQPKLRCRVDDFISRYTDLKQNKEYSSNNPNLPVFPPLPPRGDFVRFVRRHSEFFTYDSKDFVIALVGAPPLYEIPPLPSNPHTAIGITLGEDPLLAWNTQAGGQPPLNNRKSKNRPQQHLPPPTNPSTPPGAMNK